MNKRQKLRLKSQEAQQDCLAVVLFLEKMWGRHAALKWLMGVKGYNLATALRVISLHKQLLAVDRNRLAVTMWVADVKMILNQIMKFGKQGVRND